jgi:spore coat polysaccharide biosynthesis protein SpsF (cytidylyltransferase family)
MSVLIVIPARFASSRYPAKPLAQLKGATGTSRSLIRRSWDAAMSVNGADRVVVATDDVRIADHAAAFGAEVVMTAESCRNGTERCAEAHEKLGGGFDIVVNLQGDAPLTPAWFVEDLVTGLRANPGAEGFGGSANAVVIGRHHDPVDALDRDCRAPAPLDQALRLTSCATQADKRLAGIAGRGVAGRDDQ